MDLTFAARLRRPEQLAGLMAAGVTAISLAALVGWRLGVVALISVVPGAVALQPLTALALIAGALGLVAEAAGRRRTSRAAAAVLLAVCLMWLVADVAQRPLPMDLLLYRNQVLAQQPAPPWPGRPSILTCVVMALFAVSLLGASLSQLRLRLAALCAASLGAILATLSVLPFALQDPSQLSILNQDLRIALNTAVALGALCAGVFILLRDIGWVRLVASDEDRGRIARLLAPVALIPTGFAMITNQGVRAGLYAPNVRMLLNMGLSGCTLLVLAFWAAHMLGRERAERDSLVDALQRSTVMIVDGQGKLRHWPPACEALYGWTAAEVLGRNPGDFLNAESASVREKTGAAIRAAIREHGEWRGEIQHWTKSGDIRWVALQWVRQSGDGENEERVVGTISDITELKLAQASLQESRERVKLAVDAYDLGIADADIASGVVVADGGFERLLGLPPGGLSDGIRTLNSMVVSAEPDRDADIAARRSQQFDDLQMRRADGEVRDFHGVRRFFYSPEGVHVRTIGVYRDVTEERRAQVELAKRGDRLAELRSELAHVSRLSTMGEMAAALAHELNQPLTAIGNSVGALKIMLGDGGKSLDDTTRARVVRAADQAESQAVRAGEIVRRLRDFISRGEADARMEYIGPLIEDAVALAAPNAKSDQIEIRLELSPRASRILADRIQIQQVLVNLIRNAAEAMQEVSTPRILTIRTTARHGMVEVSVRDTGPGIAPKFSQQLFSPFQSTKTTGMGVGLSICRRIVEAHGGTMWLEDTPDAGADFRFTVPQAARERRHAQ
jgi:two-component system sensor kinase FixL